jgi:hypothetical protein
MEAPDRHTAFEPTTRTRIPFQSATDALLAGMLFREEISAQKFEALLSVLNNPAFDAKQVTFKDPIEIFNHISAQRYAAAKNRARGSEVAGLPAIALAKVIDLLVDEIPTLDTVLHYRELSDAEKALSNMSLVHRSWSFEAQKGLGTRVFIRGNDALRSAMLSPIVGPWTREFAYKWLMTAHWKQGPIPEDPLETYTLLGGMLRRLTGLKRFSLRSNHGLCDESLVRILTNALRESPTLQYLWLSHDASQRESDNGHNSFLIPLYEALPSMRSLKNLSISGWNSGDATVFPSLPPGTSLKCVDIPPRLSQACLSWLTCPRGGFSLEKFKYAVPSTSSREYVDRLITTLAPSLSQVTALSLSVSLGQDNVEDSKLVSTVICMELLAQTRNLKDLTISAFTYGLESKPASHISIPSTVERVCFAFTTYEPSEYDALKSYWTNVNQLFTEMIADKNSKLKTAIMAHIDLNRRTPASPGTGIIDGTRGIPTPFLEVAEECDRRGGSFVFLYGREKLRELGLD